MKKIDNVKKKVKNWINIFFLLLMLTFIVNIARIFGVSFLQHEIPLFNDEYATQIVFFLSFYIVLDILKDILKQLEDISKEINDK